MKYVCPACERIVEISAFRLEGEVLWLKCSRCDAESRQMAGPPGGPAASTLPPAPPRSSAAAAPSSPRPVISLVASTSPDTLSASDLTVPDDRCPKCITPIRPGSASCNQCGLAYANALPDEYGPSPELGALWSGLLGRWSDAKAHDALLLTAATAGELAACGRLYRIRLARSPQDALAKRGLEEVLRLASVPAIIPPAAPAPTGPARWQLWAAGALGLVLLAMMVILLRMTRAP